MKQITTRIKIFKKKEGENEDFNENSSEEFEENNEELKAENLYMTKSIKKVFIDNKRLNDDKNEEFSNSTFDYELNFYHNKETLRGSYISKLISTRIWNPELKNKNYLKLIHSKNGECSKEIIQRPKY